MKGILTVFTGIFLAAGAYAGGFPDAISQASKSFTNVQALQGPVQEQFKGRKILIVYFGGHNVKRVSDDLSRITGADVIRITDLINRRFAQAGRDSSLGLKTRIAPLGANLSAYEVIIVGTVVWAWNMSPAIRTFLSENKNVLRNKKMAFFTVAGGTEPGKIVKKMSRVADSQALAAAGWNNPELADNGQASYKKIIDVFINQLAGALKNK